MAGSLAKRFRGLSRADGLGLAFVAAYAVVGLATFVQYGITWDETLQARYGELVLHYFLTSGADQRYLQLANLRFYGPLFETICAAASHLGRAQEFEIRHLLVLVTGVLTALAVWRIARRLEAPLAPLIAVAALVLTPRFYGHAFANSKDIPFACAFTWGIEGILEALDPRRLASVKGLARAGLLAGVAIAVRIGGVLLVGFGVAAVCIDRWVRGRVGEPTTTMRTLVLGCLAFVGAAWAVMVALWPWVQQQPLVRPLEAIRMAEAFPQTLPVRFAGAFVLPANLPRSYLPRMLAITLPLPVEALALVGAVVAVAWMASRGRPRARLPLGVVLVWLFFPVAFAVVAHTHLYDGMRHFLFVVPAVAILAGFGGDHLVGLARSPRVRNVLFVGLGAAGATIVVRMAALHPYEMTFYNPLVGGLRGAAGRYDTDYWASSYREAALWTVANAPSIARGRPLRILLGGNELSGPCFAHYLPAGLAHITLVKRTGIAGSLPSDYDLFVSTTRWNLDRDFPASPIVHRIGRDGAVFTVIRARQPLPARAETRGVP